jgi:hypothetical protein
MWVTIDIEEIDDMHFNIKWRSIPELNYEKLVDIFIDFSRGFKTTAFIVGTFAQKYPHLVKKLSENGVEIGCHGNTHTLVYEQSFEQWCIELDQSKKLLEQITSKKVVGYRSPSWSMPFEKRYYEELARQGFSYSSSYFPIKTHMYGNSIDKKEFFTIFTQYGKIQERPIAKKIIPFSGGFYLRVLPLWLLKILFKNTPESILYTHPYELESKNLLLCLKRFIGFNIGCILAFYSTGSTKNKIISILNNE